MAIARGLVNRPPVILADEPTAPLDSERAMAVIRILNEMADRFETAIIVVTHDEKIIPTFKRIYHIRDGVTHEEKGEGGRSRERLHALIRVSIDSFLDLRRKGHALLSNQASDHDRDRSFSDSRCTEPCGEHDAARRRNR